MVLIRRAVPLKKESAMKLSREPQSFSFKAYVSKVDGIVEENSGTSLVRYSPTEGRDEITDERVLYNCISFVKEYADKSLEELRLEDYKAGRVSKELPLGNFIYRFNTAPASTSKSSVKKTGAVKAYEVIAKRFETKFFVPNKRRHVVGEQERGTTLVKYEPKMDTELYGTSGHSVCPRVTYICISIMKEYENKSLEELRLEDYRAGRNVLVKYAEDYNYNPNFFVFGFYESYAFSFRDKETLRFHTVHGGNVKISKDGRSAELTEPKNYGVAVEDTVAFSCRPIRVDEVVHLHLDDIWLHCNGIAFGFTTLNPSEIFPYLPKYAASETKSWTKTLSDISCEKKILHYSVDSTGVLRSGVNGQIHDQIISGIDISRPLWAVIDLRRCKKIRFHSNQSQVANGFRRFRQVIKRAGRSNQSQVEGGDRRPEQGIERTRRPEQVIEGAGRPEQGIEEAGCSNQSQNDEGARRPEQGIEEAGCSNQSQVESATRPEQVVDEISRPNQSQVDDVAGRPEQVVEGAGHSNQSQVESATRPEQVVDGISRPNQSQVDDVAGRPNQSQIDDVAGRPEQVVEGAGRPNQTLVDDVAGRPEQVVEGAGRPNQTQVDDVAGRPEQVVDGARRPKKVIEVARDAYQSLLDGDLLLEKLRFHTVHGGSIRISNDGSTAERIGSQDDTLAFSSRPIRVDEMVYLHLDEIWMHFVDITFGFTTVNPSEIFPYLPKYATSKEKSWTKTLHKIFSMNKKLLHYSVDRNGVLRFGVNGQIQIIPGIDISRPLWAVIDLRRCIKVHFVGPEALNDVRLNQSIEGASRPEQVIEGARRPKKVIEVAKNAYQSLFDGELLLDDLRFHTVHGGSIRLSNYENTAERTGSQGDTLAFSSRPIRVDEMVYLHINHMSMHFVDITFGFTTVNPSEIFPYLPKYATSKEKSWTQTLQKKIDFDMILLHYSVNPNGVLRFGVNGQNHIQIIPGIDISRPLWTVIDLRRSTQVTFVGPEMLNEVRLNQSIEGAGRSYRSWFDDDLIVDQLSSLSVIERSPFPKHLNPVPLSIHRTKGKNVVFTGTGIAARSEGEYCQGYVFSARPMLPGKTITAQILKTDNSLRSSLIIGLTSCDPSTIDPDELPDEAKFLPDRPEYWIIYPDAANGYDIGDELNLTLTLDGKLEVCKNSSDNVAVLHVDHTLKLWAFFDIYGATEEVRLFVSELVKQTGDEAGRPDGVVNGARRADQVVHEARYYDYGAHAARRPNQVVNGARRPNQVVNRARRPNQVGNGASTFEQIQDRARRSAPRIDGARHSDQMVDAASRSYQTVNKVNAHTTVESMPSTSKSNEQPTNECRICFDNRINCAIYKCGHMCMCYDCAVQQWKNDGRSYGKCPICRAKIEDVIRIYNS